MIKSTIETCPAKSKDYSKLTSSKTGTEVTNIVDMSPTSLDWDGDQETRQKGITNKTIDVSSDSMFLNKPKRI